MTVIPNPTGNNPMIIQERLKNSAKNVQATNPAQIAVIGPSPIRGRMAA